MSDMSDMTTFSDPTPASQFKAEEHNGELMVVRVLDVETGIETSFGTCDAVRCSITVIDGQHADETYDDVLLFPKALVAALRGYAGKAPVLGRLGKGQAKQGQSAPWVLNAATDDEKKTAADKLARGSQNGAEPEVPF